MISCFYLPLVPIICFYVVLKHFENIINSDTLLSAAKDSFISFYLENILKAKPRNSTEIEGKIRGIVRWNQEM